MTRPRGAFDKLVVDGAATLGGSVLLRNNLALSGEVFPLVSYGSRRGSFGSITTSNTGTATATHLASRADFTVTADAPDEPAPELAASYDDWIASVERRGGDGAAGTVSGANGSEGEGMPARTRRAWNPAPMADPDGDGAVKLLEYAFQTNPLDAASMARLETHADAARPGGLDIRHRMRAAAVDVSYVIEHSSDLKTWLPLEADAPGYEGSSVQLISNGTQMKNIRLNTFTSPGTFFRVQVISNTR